MFSFTSIILAIKINNDVTDYRTATRPPQVYQLLWEREKASLSHYVNRSGIRGVEAPKSRGPRFVSGVQGVLLRSVLKLVLLRIHRFANEVS